jgi:hypothetical protein
VTKLGKAKNHLFEIAVKICWTGITVFIIGLMYSFVPTFLAILRYIPAIDYFVSAGVNMFMLSVYLIILGVIIAAFAKNNTCYRRP